jgi:hypothetical protein
VDEKEKGPPNLAPPQVSERSSPPRTLVELGDDQADPAVGDRPKESEEYIEEIFGLGFHMVVSGVTWCGFAATY